jgi:hypothetical protein
MDGISTPSSGGQWPLDPALKARFLAKPTFNAPNVVKPKVVNPYPPKNDVSDLSQPLPPPSATYSKPLATPPKSVVQAQPVLAALAPANASLPDFSKQTDPQAIGESIWLHNKYSEFNKQGAVPQARVERSLPIQPGVTPWAQAFPLYLGAPSYVQVLETRVSWLLKNGKEQVLPSGAKGLEGAAFRYFDDNGKYLVDSSGNAYDAQKTLITHTDSSTTFYPSEFPERATHFWETDYDKYPKPANAVGVRVAYKVQGTNAAVQVGIDDKYFTSPNLGDIGVGNLVAVTSTPKWVTFDSTLGKKSP